MPTLDEMRARKGAKAPRPKSTHTVTLVTGQHLLDEQKRLNDELLDLLAKGTPVAENDAEVPRKMSDRTVSPRVEEIRDETKALYDRLGEHQGQVTLVGVLSDGDWLRWKEDHPPREDNEGDARIGLGYCNATDLYAELGRFVAEWGGEPLSDGEWDAWLGEQITFADKRDLVTEVVGLYESRLNRAPKSLDSSSATTSGSSD